MKFVLFSFLMTTVTSLLASTAEFCYVKEASVSSYSRSHRMIELWVGDKIAAYKFRNGPDNESDLLEEKLKQLIKDKECQKSDFVCEIEVYSTTRSQYIVSSTINGLLNVKVFNPKIMTVTLDKDKTQKLIDIHVDNALKNVKAGYCGSYKITNHLKLEKSNSDI